MLEFRGNSKYIIKLREIAVMACVLLVSALVLLRDAGGFSFPKTLIVGIFVIAMALSDKSDIYCLLAFMTPISKGVSYSYIAFFALFLLMFKVKKLKIGICALISIVGILMLELCSGFRPDFNFVDYVRFVGIFAVCFYFMNDRDNSYDVPKMMRFFLFGFIVTILSLWGQMLRQYSLASLFLIGIRFGDTRGSLSISEGMVISYNENELAFLCILSLWIGYSYFRYGGKLRGMIFMILATVQGVLTQSRTFVLVLIVSLLVILLTSITSKNSLLTILSLVVVVVLGIFLLRKYFVAYLENLILRFKEADISGNRGYIMKEYFNVWASMPWRILFGMGLQNYSARYGLPFYAHNSTQEVLLIWGITGMFFVLMLMIVSVYSSKKTNPKAVLWQYAPFAIYLLTTQSAQGFSDFAGLFRMMMAFSIILIRFPSKEEVCGIEIPQVECKD